MHLKDNVLKSLEECRGGYLSGEELAEKFGVSRNAVWKAVKALRKDGYEILSAVNRGYALSEGNDLLSEGGIQKYLRGDGYRLTLLKSAGSTNDEAKKIAEAGGAEWSAVIAEEQTAGRGRYARPFYSPKGEGLYISILLRPKFPAAETLFITTSAAVAVCEAIEAVSGQSAQIKWVNDVLIGGKKVCGILTEASFSVENGGLSYAVVGIGVNVREQSFPPELQGIAASVFGKNYPPEGRARIAAEILNRFRGYYEKIPERAFFNEYKRRSAVLGKRVRVLSGNLQGDATVLDLDENCFLKVRFDDGTERLLSSGELSVKIQ